MHTIPEYTKTLRGVPLLQDLLTRSMPKRLALVSSFGAESAVLLHMVSEIDPATPVIFLNTGKMFQETLSYKYELVDRFKLSHVLDVHPENTNLKQDDPNGRLWQNDPDQCCHIRKTLPLERALSRHDGWITGRKRFQTAKRQHISAIEQENGKIKVNPLIDFTPQDITDYFSHYNLPRHPLYQKGYLSIGCETCTVRPSDPNDPRSGRWRHASEKTECGIHIVDGKIVRKNPG